jgi:DNA-binding transcriptional LysR family regulator
MLRDELGVLAAFAVVADERSFTKAAVRLGVIAMALSPKLARFARDYPDVVLDITTEDDSRRDLVASRFDARIHLGEFLQRDMVAAKVTGEQRAAIVAAPAYFDSRPTPKTPRELTAHRCIRYRMGTGGPVYRWEFEKRGRPVTVSVSGPLIVDDVELTLRAALDGVGLSFALEEHVTEHIARGRLVRVLEDWCPPLDGFFLYYPSRRHQPAALQALVDALRV